MARLFVQYLAIYNNDNLPDSKNLLNTQYTLKTIIKDFLKICQWGEISQYLVTLILLSIGTYELYESTQLINSWSSLVVGDEGCIGPSGNLPIVFTPKIVQCMPGSFSTCLTVGPIWSLVSYQRAPRSTQLIEVAFRVGMFF